MAEAAVNFALETLGSLLKQEIKLLGSAKQGVKDMEEELDSIRAFLKDADARAAAEEGGENNEGVLTWVKQVRQEAYRIEDVIDEFSLTVAQLPHGNGLLGVLNKITRFAWKLKVRYEVTNEIQSIKSLLVGIKERAERYKFSSTDQGATSGTINIIEHDSRVATAHIEGSEVVGIESARDELIGWLVNGRKRRSVIVIVGEGGLGKTTLAGRFYDHEVVKSHFSCQAWITVGKESNKIHLLRKIIQKINCPAQGDIDKMDEDGLITTLSKHLQDMQYMVVFDDVWKIQFWEDIEHALPDNYEKSSRIMLTTRDKRVAYQVPEQTIYSLQPLPPEKAWKLFCAKAFGPYGRCPSELQELSENIVGKCGGLPIAIAAVGRLLSTKNKVASEWRILLDSLGSTLESDPHLRNCNRVLSEGYYHLPLHLKTCFLYFGLFPESHSISCGRLMRLWIAEGLVPYSKKKPSEQTAENYLNELIDRSLVQVVDRDITGRARTCKVHDLMYEIIIRKTEGLDFCRVLKEEDSNLEETRRISIQGSTDRVLESIRSSKIRAVLLFASDNRPDCFIATFVADFKLLKV